MTRSLTGDWTRDLPHLKPALYHQAIEEAARVKWFTIHLIVPLCNAVNLALGNIWKNLHKEVDKKKINKQIKFLFIFGSSYSDACIPYKTIPSKHSNWTLFWTSNIKIMLLIHFPKTEIHFWWQLVSFLFNFNFRLSWLLVYDFLFLCNFCYTCS